MDWLLILFGLGVFLMVVAPVSLAVTWAIRRSRGVAIVGLATTTAAVVWLTTVYLFLTGARDLDGMFDCYPDCSTSQEGAGAILFYVPMLTAVVFAGFILTITIRRARRRAGQRTVTD